MNTVKKPKVFISYSWDSDEHKENAKIFAENLKNQTQFEIIFDRFRSSTPYGGWIQWMKLQIESADFVILICTKRYYELFEGNQYPVEPARGGKGVKWESRLVYKDIYNQTKDISVFFPVYFSDKDEVYIPTIFDCTSYNLNDNGIQTLFDGLHEKWNEISQTNSDHFLDNRINIYNTPATTHVKKLLHNIDIDLFKKIIYSYLPISYFGTLFGSADELIDKLLDISTLPNGGTPILCVLNELNSKKPNIIIEDYVHYLEMVKFHYTKAHLCQKNESLKDCTFIINFEVEDGKEGYNITTWRFANNEFRKINLGNLNQLNKFFDAIFQYADEITSIYGSNIYFEIVLPDDKIYQSIKDWKNSDGYSLIRKYKYILRLQTRFIQPDNTWRTKWTDLDLVNNTDFLAGNPDKDIKGTTYNNEISNSFYTAALDQKIDNPLSLFRDVKEFGIPIVLSPLSVECKIDALKKMELKSCKEVICTYMMNNHSNSMSDILFILDDPEKIPDIYQNPEDNKYGY